jgi:hypothetical protein
MPRRAIRLSPGFNPDLYTQFGETEDTWKARLMVRTIQAGSLYYIAFPSVERSLEDILRYLRDPTATTRRRKVA